MGYFDGIEVEIRGSSRDQFLSRAGTISLQNWKILVHVMDARETSTQTNFNNWFAFELLPQYLEHKDLQTYKRWMDAHWMELRDMERY